MAKYTVTAGCGHTSELQLFGPTTERQRRLDWMASESGLCNACYAASKRAEEAARPAKEAQALADRIVRQYSGPPPADVVAQLREQIASGAGTAEKRELMAAALDILGV